MENVQVKKIFILTGEPSGDKLASTVVTKLQQNHPEIEYLSVGGYHLNKLGIKSIYDLKEITYIGFTSVILNLFKIRSKINETVKKIIEFKNISSYVKKMFNNPAINTTTNFDHIKRHYYFSHEHINPYRIIPLGPNSPI